MIMSLLRLPVLLLVVTTAAGCVPGPRYILGPGTDIQREAPASDWELPQAKRWKTANLPEPGWDPAAATRYWSHIVIHHSATPSGSARMFHEHHLKTRGWRNGLGYHFVIGNGTNSGDGRIEVGPRWRRQIPGAHAGKRYYNDHGIGICLVGDFNKTQPTPKQMAALKRLVRYLQKRNFMPLEDIVGHRRVKSATGCPGKNFSMQAFRGALAADADTGTGRSLHRGRLSSALTR